jgi:hypothetical protein
VTRPADATQFTHDLNGNVERSGTPPHDGVLGEGQDPMATAGGIGGILAVTTSTGPQLSAFSPQLFCHDGNANVMNLADAASVAPLATHEYSPFGNTLVAADPLAGANPIRFSAK